jgi:hypothetical protein
VIAQLLATVLAAEGDAPVWLLIIGPAGAGGVYYGLWHYYRNATKSHAFEKETRVEAQPITGSDTKVNEVKGTKRTSIEGDNRDDHRRRVQRVP